MRTYVAPEPQCQGQSQASSCASPLPRRAGQQPHRRLLQPVPHLLAEAGSSSQHESQPTLGLPLVSNNVQVKQNVRVQVRERFQTRQAFRQGPSALTTGAKRA